MRLGSYPCKVKEDSLAYKLYKSDLVNERHRHRYEFNNDYYDEFIENGMVISGIYEKKKLVEIIELPSNSFHLSVQFHPEFKSRPDKPHPLFIGFISAALNYKW